MPAQPALLLSMLHTQAADPEELWASMEKWTQSWRMTLLKSQPHRSQLWERMIVIAREKFDYVLDRASMWRRCVSWSL